MLTFFTSSVIAFKYFGFNNLGHLFYSDFNNCEDSELFLRLSIINNSKYINEKPDISVNVFINTVNLNKRGFQNI